MADLISSRYNLLPGNKTTRTDGNLEVSTNVNGKRVFVFGCLDIDGFGPRSLATDTTAPPDSADSSFAHIKVLSTDASKLEAGQRIEIEHGTETLKLEVGGSTSVSGFFIDGSSDASTLAQSIVDVINAGSKQLKGEILPSDPDKAIITQKSGSGLKRIIVRRKDSDIDQPKVSREAMKIETGSTDPRFGGKFLEFNNPRLVAQGQAPLILKNSSRVGPTNELRTGFSEVSSGGGTNVATIRLDYTLRQDEDNNWWPVKQSTGTIPDEWLFALGIDPKGVDAPVELLDPLTHWVPSKKFRNLPWINSPDLGTAQVHKDISRADFRYWAIGKAMDIAQDADPEIIHYAIPPNYITAAIAEEHPSIGFYPIPLSQVPEDQTVLNEVIATDLPVPNNKHINSFIYDTSKLEPFPFKSTDVVGYQSDVTLTVPNLSTNGKDVSGSVLPGAGFTVEVNGEIRTYYYAENYNPNTAEFEIEAVGDPSTVVGRARLARAIANTINSDSSISDSQGQFINAVADNDKVILSSTKAGFSGGVKVLPTRTTILDMKSIGSSNPAPSDGDSIGITEASDINPEGSIPKSFSIKSNFISEATLTVEVGNVSAGDSFTISVGDESFGFTAVTGTPNVTIGEFEVGASEADTASNIASTVAAVIPDTTLASVTASTTVVTFVSATKGRSGNISITDTAASLTESFINFILDDEYDGSGSENEAAESFAVTFNREYGSREHVWAVAEGTKVYVFERSGLTALNFFLSDNATALIPTSVEPISADSITTVDVIDPDGSTAPTYNFFVSDMVASTAGSLLKPTMSVGDQITVTQGDESFTVELTSDLNVDTSAKWLGSGNNAGAEIDQENIIRAFNSVAGGKWEVVLGFGGGVGGTKDIFLIVRSLVPGSENKVTLKLTTDDSGSISDITYSKGLQSSGAKTPKFEGSDPFAVERNFGYLSGAFCFNTSIDFMSCKHIVGLDVMATDLDTNFSIEDMQNYLGKERSHTSDRFIDNLEDNGTGILGFTNMKIFDGTKRLQAAESTPAGYRMWAGQRITRTSSWSDVHVLASNSAYDDLLIKDSNSERVDLGAYVVVVAEEGLYFGPGASTIDKRNSSYLTNAAGVFTASNSVRSVIEGMTRSPIRNFRPIRAKSAQMRKNLTKLRFVTFIIEGGSTLVEDAMTMAYNIDEGNRSDYVRLMTFDIVNQVHKVIRLKTRPFLGKNMSPDLISALRDRVDQDLKELMDQGLILNKDYKLDLNPTDRILNQARINLRLQVPGELRQLLTNTGLAVEI